MNEDPDETPPCPPTWRADLVDRADLEASFRALAPHEHFFAEALRGWVRTLQLRIAEAEEHFGHARELARGVRPTVANIARRFLSEVYSSECTLLKGPPPLRSRPPLSSPLPPAEIASEWPEVRLVVELCRAFEGRFLLHAGDCERGARLFGRLLAERRRESGSELAAWYLGLAACQHGLELDEPSIRSIENAELATLNAAATLSAARDAASLAAFWSFLGSPDRASEWTLFLRRLPCPEATRDAFRERSDRISQRCHALGRLVVL